MKRLLGTISVLVLLSLNGCASTMSRGVLDNVDRSVDITDVQANPTAHAGRKIVWGGLILNATVLESSTEIEVLETPLGYDDVPESGSSKGRFIIESKGFLDPNVFKANFGITVVGTVSRTKTGKIGMMDYLYPVVTPLEMKIFDTSKPPMPPYPYPSPWRNPYYPWYGPYDPFYEPYYSPFYDPFYGPYRPHRFSYPPPP
ncbi:MAG: hypothetical protein A3J24_05005 [Deltaproteobacteria bacterium RIFCSPLOWO2_02_FULL_53_8]|nr:MAG: hypothetical protein A3J24_05005 [Deltaproteobacteria bacterium RIFCSPLOWO2_02_FULL_53_8]